MRLPAAMLLTLCTIFCTGGAAGAQSPLAAEIRAFSFRYHEDPARIDTLRPCGIESAVETLRDDLAEIGLMIKEASSTALVWKFAYMLLIPALSVSSLILGFNLMADGLREMSMRD